jgi:hypothetical protein
MANKVRFAFTEIAYQFLDFAGATRCCKHIADNLLELYNSDRLSILKTIALYFLK